MVRIVPELLLLRLQNELYNLIKKDTVPNCFKLTLLPPEMAPMSFSAAPLPMAPISAVLADSRNPSRPDSSFKQTWTVNLHEKKWQKSPTIPYFMSWWLWRSVPALRAPEITALGTPKATLRSTKVAALGSPKIALRSAKLPLSSLLHWGRAGRFDSFGNRP